MRSAIVNVVLAMFLLAAGAVGAQNIVTLSTREGVTQSFLLIVPAGGKPAAAAVLFPGGSGLIRLRSEDGRIRFGDGNFLVRSRELFAERGVAAALMDAPSDQALGMNDLFRLGDQHVTDVTAVVTDLKKRFGNIPILLVGTSRGSISVASLGRKMGREVSGAILTSTLFHGGSRFGPALDGFEFSKISIPVLVVHHINDGCKESPYREAKRLAETRRYPLITVSGGKPATSHPCEGFSPHGYLGKEPETVDAMVNWILKNPYSTNIE